MLFEIIIFLLSCVFIILVHEFGHYVTAKYFGVFDSFFIDLNPKSLFMGISLGIKVKDNCPLKEGIIIRLAGVFLSLPYAIIIDSILGTFTIFSFFAIAISFYDILSLVNLLKLMAENPFAYYMPKETKIEIKLARKYFYEVD